MEPLSVLSTHGLYELQMLRRHQQHQCAIESFSGAHSHLKIPGTDSKLAKWFSESARQRSLAIPAHVLAVLAVHLQAFYSRVGVSTGPGRTLAFDGL